MFVRSVLFLIVFTVVRYFLEQAQANPALDDGVVFGWILACIDLPRAVLGWVMGPRFMAMHPQSMALSPTFFWLMFWLWLNYDPDLPRVTLYQEPQFTVPHALNERLDTGFRWRNALGLFVLSDVEQDVFNRIQTALPERLQRPFQDQRKRFTRSQRLFLNPERTRAFTAFQGIRCLVFPERFPKRLPMPQDHDEDTAVFARCTVLTPKQSVLVELVMDDGVLVRLDYTSDYDLATFPRPYTLTDVRLNQDLLQPDDRRMRRRTPLNQTPRMP